MLFMLWLTIGVGLGYDSMRHTNFMFNSGIKFIHKGPFPPNAICDLSHDFHKHCTYSGWHLLDKPFAKSQCLWKSRDKSQIAFGSWRLGLYIVFPPSIDSAVAFEIKSQSQIAFDGDMPPPPRHPWQTCLSCIFWPKNSKTRCFAPPPHDQNPIATGQCTHVVGGGAPLRTSNAPRHPWKTCLSCIFWPKNSKTRYFAPPPHDQNPIATCTGSVHLSWGGLRTSSNKMIW
jgi:hypothetical protein